MSLYPYNTNVSLRAQTDAQGVYNRLVSAVQVDLGKPAVDDDDYFVTSTNMKVGAYTLAKTAPDVPRNVTVTQTAAGTADTSGTIVVAGTDIGGQAITETITPESGKVVAGTKAFKTITSITGAGWVIADGNDTIKVGFGSRVGLPDKLSLNTVLLAILNGSVEATAPTVTLSGTDLANNTVDFNSAWGGTQAYVYYLV